MYVLKVEHKLNSLPRSEGYLEKIDSKGQIITTYSKHKARVYKSLAVANNRASSLNHRYDYILTKVGYGYRVEKYIFHVETV